MGSSKISMILFSILPLFFFFFFSISSAQQPPFSCHTANANCSALIDYVSPNATTLAAVQALFSVRNIRSLLGANNLPISTRPSHHHIVAQQTIRIPFTCGCTTNGVPGVSAGGPIYTVVPQDGLDHIAREVFAGLVTYQQIAEANNISDPNTILVGDRLRIPLPCSCDDVDGQRVVHYGHVVVPGNNLTGIAAQYNTTSETLLRLNNLTSHSVLLAGSVLDVPLRTCSSRVNNTSRDYPLLVPNGTYIVTANNCVTCTCNDTSSWVLQCEPSRLNSSSCSTIRPCAPNLNLGNTVSSGCNRTTCAYAGYSNQTILTMLDLDRSTCPASDNRPNSVNKKLSLTNPTAAMSSEKVCSHHKSKRKKAFRHCCAGLLVLVFLTLLVILIVWAVLQPKKPRFILQDATIFSLNVSAPNVISTTLQVTIYSRNPNSRIGIYYDRLGVFANYHNQQVTLFSGIQPVYQGHKDVNIWSPFIYGNNVPVAPYNGMSLSQDQSKGYVMMTIKVNGRVKWRVGSFVSGRYHLHVSCPVYIPLGNSKNTGIVVGNGVKYQISQSCSVSV